MLTSEEKEEIIQEATERMLLAIPEVIGNLMANHAALHKINKKFYADHPEFSKDKDVVQSVVEVTEGTNPLLDYEEILKKSIPEIQKRIQIKRQLNMDKVPGTIPTDFSAVDTNNGVV